MKECLEMSFFLLIFVSLIKKEIMEERTVYPEYDFANNGQMMHFGSFVRKEKDGESYLIPVVRHYTSAKDEELTKEIEEHFIAESIDLCERVKEKYIIDEKLSDVHGFKLFIKENKNGEV